MIKLQIFLVGMLVGMTLVLGLKTLCESNLFKSPIPIVERLSPILPITPKEVNREQYQKLVEHSIKNRSYKMLVLDAFSDGMISHNEFIELEKIYDKILRMDNIQLLLQEKAYEKRVDAPDGE